jgi:hypothetical protein
LRVAAGKERLQIDDRNVAHGTTLAADPATVRV